MVGGVANAGSELVVLEVVQPYSNHNGGAVRFGFDGMKIFKFHAAVGPVTTADVNADVAVASAFGEAASDCLRVASRHTTTTAVT